MSTQAFNSQDMLAQISQQAMGNWDYGQQGPTNTNYQPNGGLQAFNNQTQQMGYDNGFGQTQIPAFGQQQEQAGGFGSASGGMPSLEQFGSGVGIAKDLYGMYQSNQGMDLAKDQLGMQKQAYQDNVANRDRIVNASKQAFA